MTGRAYLVNSRTVMGYVEKDLLLQPTPPLSKQTNKKENKPWSCQTAAQEGSRTEKQTQCLGCLQNIYSCVVLKKKKSEREKADKFCLLRIFALGRQGTEKGERLQEGSKPGKVGLNTRGQRWEGLPSKRTLY